MKMSVIYFGALIFGLVGLEVTEGAVNLTGVWFLAHEDYPVFYQRFYGGVTWERAEAYCQYHNAHLVQVQTVAQMDAVRAYLEKIDDNHEVWIGLKKDSLEEPFSWVNGEKVQGDGNWLEPIPKTDEKLCVTMDPKNDFRWRSYYCDGPQMAPFMCELPVPEWVKEKGCLISSVPTVVNTLLTDWNVIQLFSDCGLKGTRRIACSGQEDQDLLLRKLDCSVDWPLDSSTSTTDLNTEASPDSEVNDIKTTNTLEVHETRHRRDINLITLEIGVSPPPTNTNLVLNMSDPISETSTQTTPTQAKTKMPKFLFHTPSRIPPTESDAKIPVETAEVTTKTENLKSTVKKVKSENKKQPILLTELFIQISMDTVPPSNLSISNKLSNKKKTATTTVKLEKSFKTPDFNRNSSLEDKSKVSSGSNYDVPVLVTTGESLNESENSSMSTSENPEIVFMIDDKEDFSKHYLVPIGDDVVLNNPSLSPMEVIDVDFVEIDNFTTRTTTSDETNSKYQTTDLPSSETQVTPEINETTETTNEVAQNESSTVLPDLSTTATPPKPTSTFATTTPPKPTSTFATTTSPKPTSTFATTTPPKPTSTFETTTPPKPTSTFATTTPPKPTSTFATTTPPKPTSTFATTTPPKPTSTFATTIPPKPTSTFATTKSTEPPKSIKQPETFLQSDDTEELDMPQRPNRGRHLSQHPNHSSFYPYFLNRVWG